MASLSTCHLGLWLGWQLLLNLVKVLRKMLDVISEYVSSFVWSAEELILKFNKLRPSWVSYLLCVTNFLFNKKIKKGTLLYSMI